VSEARTAEMPSAEINATCLSAHRDFDKLNQRSPDAAE